MITDGADEKHKSQFCWRPIIDEKKHLTVIALVIVAILPVFITGL